MSREAHVRFWEGVGVQLLCATQLGERHLLGILSKYVDYYNGTRTHLSLAKDEPTPRSVQPPSQGRVAEVPRVGGLHHEYLRRAAGAYRTDK